MAIDFIDSLTALSVIFGVAIFHLGNSKVVIDDLLSRENPPQGQKDARGRLRRSITSAAIFSWLPGFAMLLAIFFVMTPTAIDNLSALSFSLWGFDIYASLFQILWSIIFFYLTASMTVLIRLLLRVYSLR